MEDPIQVNFRKKLEEAGVKLSKKNTNREFTPEEKEARKKELEKVNKLK